MWWWSSIDGPENSAQGEYRLESGQEIVTTSVDSSPSSISRRFNDILLDPDRVGVWNKFVDGGQNPLPLNNFLSAVGVRTGLWTGSSLEQNSWYLYRCAPSGGASDGTGGLVLAVSFNENESLDNVKRGLLSWETAMVADVSQFLFPYDTYRSSALPAGSFSNGPGFTYSTQRYIAVNIEGYGQREIGYINYDRELLIGNDRNCLREAEERLFEVRG